MPPTALPAAPAPLLRAPLHKDGRLALGPALDGPGHAYYRLKTPRRMHHGVIVADPGAGASNLATVLMVTARASMPLATAYVNGRGEPTNPALARQVTALLDGDDVADTALAALERAVDVRRGLLTAAQACSYTAAGLPAVLVVVKNADRVFTGRGHRWATVARQAGLLGIGLLATMADTGLSSFGGSSTLRELLCDQLVVLRTHDPRVKTAVFAAMGPLAPDRWPTGVGRATWCGPGSWTRTCGSTARCGRCR